MDREKLTLIQRQARQAVRNFLLVATLEELNRDKEISLEQDDQFRAECVQELINEVYLQ